jgi:hypothetical protein
MSNTALAAAFACLTIPLGLPAQAWEMVYVGNRVRVTTTESVLPSPDAPLGRLQRMTGTVTTIAPETLYVSASPADPPLGIPRILIWQVEVSLGEDRRGSIPDAAFTGFGAGAIAMLFVSDALKPMVIAAATALGAAYGGLFPYERWRRAWLPE